MQNRDMKRPFRSRSQGESLLKTYLRYMSPSVYALVLYSAYTILNGILISRWVNETAMGAMNIASPFISVIYAYSLIFGVGGSTVISIYKGRGETDRANEAFTLNVVFLLGSVVLLSLLAFVFVEPLARLLGATPDNMDYVVRYLKPVTLLAVAHGGSYALGVLIKTDGYPMLAILGSTASALSNVLFLFLFTKILKLDILGAAWAANLGQIVIFAIYLGHFFTKRAHLKFVRFRFRWSTLSRILRIGIPDAISEGSSGIFVMVFNHLVFHVLGELGIIAFSVVNYMNLLTVQLMLGITQGMQPLVSFRYGAGDEQACKKLRSYALSFGLGFSLLLYVVCFFFTEPLVTLFIDPIHAEAFGLAVHAVKLFSWCLPPLSACIVLIGYLAAIEQQLRSQVLSIGRGVALICLLGFGMSALFGQNGLWLSPVVTECIILLLAALFLLRLRKTSPFA